jgi:hypothetical protein
MEEGGPSTTNVVTAMMRVAHVLPEVNPRFLRRTLPWDSAPSRELACLTDLPEQDKFYRN